LIADLKIIYQEQHCRYGANWVSKRRDSSLEYPKPGGGRTRCRLRQNRYSGFGCDDGRTTVPRGRRPVFITPLARPTASPSVGRSDVPLARRSAGNEVRPASERLNQFA